MPMAVAEAMNFVGFMLISSLFDWTRDCRGMGVFV